jgi:hypothetical protein
MLSITFIMAVDKPCSIVAHSLITDAIKMAKGLISKSIGSSSSPTQDNLYVIKQGFITCFGSRTGVLPSYLVPTYYTI